MTMRLTHPDWPTVIFDDPQEFAAFVVLVDLIDGAKEHEPTFRCLAPPMRLLAEQESPSGDGGGMP